MEVAVVVGLGAEVVTGEEPEQSICGPCVALLG